MQENLTLRVSCLYVSIKTVWISISAALKKYIDVPFKCPHRCKSHVAVGEVVGNIFTSCALEHPGNAYNSLYKFQLFLCSDMTGFEETLRFLENVWARTIVYTCNSSIQKNL